jgi:hypothetical protein
MLRETLRLFSDVLGGGYIQFSYTEDYLLLKLVATNTPTSCMEFIFHAIIDLNLVRGFPAVSDQIL